LSVLSGGLRSTVVASIHSALVNFPRGGNPVLAGGETFGPPVSRHSRISNGASSPMSRLAHRTFTARLVALGKAHDILTRQQWEGVQLIDIAPRRFWRPIFQRSRPSPSKARPSR